MKITRRQLRQLIKEEIKITEGCGCGGAKKMKKKPCGPCSKGQPSGGHSIDPAPVAHKPHDREGRMTKAKLFRMGQMSQRLHDILYDEDDLPGWVNDKVTTAEDRLKSAHDYITYKVRK